MEALGLIENRSFLSSVVAADTALKAANVTLIDMEIIKGGYVTVQLSGDVGAVKAAVEAGSEAVRSFGTLISSHVIPRMHGETHRLISKVPEKKTAVVPKPELPDLHAEQKKNPDQLAEKKEDTEVNGAEPEQKNKEKAQVQDEVGYEDRQVKNPDVVKMVEPMNRKDLEKMTVGKLRQLARKRRAMSNAKNIKYARKVELINSLLENEEMKDSK